MEAEQGNSELALIRLTFHSSKTTLDKCVIFLVLCFEEPLKNDLDEFVVRVKLEEPQLFEAFSVVDHVLECFHLIHLRKVFPELPLPFIQLFLFSLGLLKERDCLLGTFCKFMP